MRNINEQYINALYFNSPVEELFSVLDESERDNHYDDDTGIIEQLMVERGYYK